MGNLILFCSLFVSTVLNLESSVRFPARGFAKVLTEASAQKRLSAYRSSLLDEANGSRYHEGYSMQFQLRHMPRRGNETLKIGLLSGTFMGCGASRISLAGNTKEKSPTHYLLLNGQNPKLWKCMAGNSTAQLISLEDSLEPLVEGMNQTSFDLLMPFVFWDGKYVHSGKVAGRPAHIFAFPCPPWVNKRKPDWQSVTLALDDAYDAPLRVEVLGKSQIAVRSLILRSFKKIGDQWIVKEIDCRDRKSRSVTRMKITSAALGLDLDESLFLSLNLAQPIQVDPELYLPTD